MIRGQLIRTSDWSDAGTVFAKYESEQHRYSRWGKSNAKQLRAEWNGALAGISQQIAEWLASSK